MVTASFERTMMCRRSAVLVFVTPVSPRFHEALSFASSVHADQVRKGTAIPYIAHLLAVASIVLEAGGSEDEAIAALLHDAPEDQGGLTMLAEIREKFGDRVADIVEHCSDTFETPKPPWEKRKHDYVERLRTADASVLLVSIADKLHNVRATLRDAMAHGGSSVFARFSASREQTLDNYQNLSDAYKHGAADPRRVALVADLRRSLKELRAVPENVLPRSPSGSL
jgi:(p)ppGpp synthase/HD superfamily hydrolase